MIKDVEQNPGLEKDPDEWITKDEPMTAAQESYLRTLATETGREPPSPDLTKSEASKLIDELKHQSPRLNEHD